MLRIKLKFIIFNINVKDIILIIITYIKFLIYYTKIRKYENTKIRVLLK